MRSLSSTDCSSNCAAPRMPESGFLISCASIEPSAVSERAAIAIEHYEGLLALYGREMGRRHARKHLAAYADRARENGFSVTDADRIELVTTDDPARASALLGRLFANPQRRAA